MVFKTESVSVMCHAWSEEVCSTASDRSKRSLFDHLVVWERGTARSPFVAPTMSMLRLTDPDIGVTTGLYLSNFHWEVRVSTGYD